MLTRVETEQTQRQGVELHILEDAQGPQVLRGNKRFKLSGNLACARAAGHSQVLSFGGTWSNHIHALAWAAREHGMQSIGIIRGDAGSAGSATLADAQRWGMQLEFASRSEYRKRHDPHWLAKWQRRYPDAFIMPEGGGNPVAVRACRKILDSLDTQRRNNIDVLACAVGTGAMACGLSLALHPGQKLRGYAVVADPSRQDKMHEWLSSLSPRLLPGEPGLEVIPADQPVYGRLDPGLCQFIDDFFCQTGVLLDPLYTGKMLRQLVADIDSGCFPAGSRIVAVHSGGIQGWRGLLSGWAGSLSRQTLSAVHQQTDFQ